MYHDPTLGPSDPNARVAIRDLYRRIAYGVVADHTLITHPFDGLYVWDQATDSFWLYTTAGGWTSLGAGGEPLLTAHIADPTDAHDASAISIVDAAADFTATDVEGALAELQADHETDEAALATHLADAVDAHDAGAVSVVSTTLVGVGTDAQAVFEELDNAIVAAETATADHLADTSDAHDASAISFVAGGSIAATDAQTAIAEVATDYIAADAAHVAAADPHTGYVLESLYDAKGDIHAASANNTPAKVTVGSNNYTLQADSSATAGVAWALINNVHLVAQKRLPIWFTTNGPLNENQGGVTVSPAPSDLSIGDMSIGTYSGARVHMYDGTYWTRVAHFNAAGRTGGSWTRVANQVITNNTVTDVSWDTEAFDSDGHLAHHATTGITWTCQRAGIYSCDITVKGLDNATRTFADLYYNGAVYRRQNGAPGDAVAQQIGFACKPLAVNDTIKVQVYQQSGGNKNMTGSFDIYRVSV